ncbi:hypothetical protein B0H10DRAFT_2150887 [Mycena sp. CBHHK59/15]|nr:hypothetical protein B0H10DRAFT_2150887 [Mycena sp. CBHHK59/15]
MSWVRLGFPSCTLLGLRTFALVQPRRSGRTGPGCRARPARRVEHDVIHSARGRAGAAPHR